MEGAAQAGGKKTKKDWVNVFDKERIVEMNRHYLHHTPKLEDNLRIHKMALNQPIAAQLPPPGNKPVPSAGKSPRQAEAQSDQGVKQLAEKVQNTSKISIRLRHPATASE